MRPSHHSCSLVPSIHRLSAAISERPSYDSSYVSPSRKRSRSPASSVPLSSPTLGALSYARVDMLTFYHHLRGLGRTDLEIDVDVVRSDGIDINPEIQAEIDECFAYEDALRDRGIDARVVVKGIDREEIETGVRGLVEVRVYKVTHPVIANDIPEPAQEGAVEVTYKTLGDLVQRFHDHTKEISVHRVQLEHDNRKLRDMMDVLSQRVARSQRRELRVQREMR
ncbi:hypothetical protein Tco_1579156 [Tanacetum coccineum]